MILQCRVHCYAITPEEEEQLNIPDPGAWIKAAYNLNEVKAIKQATDDITDPLYYCTSLYFTGGDHAVVDVPYDKVLHLWIATKGLPTVEHRNEDLDL